MFETDQNRTKIRKRLGERDYLGDRRIREILS